MVKKSKFKNMSVYEMDQLKEMKQLNLKFRQKYSLRAGPARIYELYIIGLDITRIVLRTGWERKDVEYVINFIEA